MNLSVAGLMTASMTASLFDSQRSDDNSREMEVAIYRRTIALERTIALAELTEASMHRRQVP